MTTREAAQRWRRLVGARWEEMAALDGERGAPGAVFSGKRGERFARQVLGTGDDDPFVQRVRATIDSSATVLDVGAGPGRIALPLAATAQAVTAVDPSPDMLEILRREARRRGLDNIDTVTGLWEETNVPAADVAVCAYVLPIVEDAEVFLRKLDAAARRRVFVALAGVSSDLTLDVFWRHFHRTRRQPAPTYLDALAVLRELGIDADVEVVEVPALSRYDDLAEAVSAFRDALLLPDDADVGAELETLLAQWLVRTADGLRPPLASGATAILSWQPSGPLPAQ